MNSLTDSQLLYDYTECRSEAAFAELVRRHVDFVYSAALRMVRDAHLAEDVTQGVFVALAQNGRRLTDRPVLSGWLHRTAQNLAGNVVRSVVRRRAREQEAAAMNELLAPEPDALWANIAPHLDAALNELSETDRDALLLRYFERKSAREMAQTLGTNEDAAQKRVSRAVERLREFFAKRGITVGASGLVVVISANAVQAAPIGLAVTISTAAALVGTTIATTATATATKVIAMTTLQKTLVTATLAVVAGAGIYEARQASQLRVENQRISQQLAQVQTDNQKLLNRPVSPDNSNKLPDAQFNELLRLRGEIGMLRRQIAEFQKADLEKAQKKAEIEQEFGVTKAGLKYLVAKARFDANEARAISDTKQLCVALYMFADEHQNQFPTNANQAGLSSYLGSTNMIGFAQDQVEFVNAGIPNLKSYPQALLVRERTPRQDPDGKWKRVYGFADGSVQIATSKDGKFDDWEKKNSDTPPVP